MDVTRAEKARLGVFVLGTSALLALVFFFMVGKKLLTRKTPYFTRLSESVSGLELGASIKQNGVDVGSVSAIVTDTSDVTKSIVRFDVEAGTPMKTDMTVTLGSFGITGLKYLEITGGSYTSPDVPAGGELRSELSTLGKFAAQADSIATKVDKLLGNFIAITDVKNRTNIDRMIASSADLGQSLGELAHDIKRAQPGRRMDAILTQMEAMSKDLRGKVRRSDLDGTILEYKKTAQEFTEVAKRIDLTVLKIQEDLGQTMNNMKETMKNMNTFSRQIKENPSVLLRREDKRERRR